jgi:hypothetical protein
MLATVLAGATLAVGCGGDEAETAASTVGPTSVTTGTRHERAAALGGTWRTRPVTLDDMAKTLRRQGLGQYVKAFRALDAEYFGEPAALVLSVDDDWDLYRKPQGGEPQPHDYDAAYKVEGDTVIVTHSDGSNTLRWSVEGDTLSFTWLEGTLPPVDGIPDGVIQTALYMTAAFERS